MKVTAWSNGKPNHETGSGFGIRISKSDRSYYFYEGTKEVTVVIETNSFQVPLSPSFWRLCHELRSPMIGRWFIANRLNKWPKRKPPKFNFVELGNNTFKLEFIG